VVGTRRDRDADERACPLICPIDGALIDLRLYQRWRSRKRLKTALTDLLQLRWPAILVTQDLCHPNLHGWRPFEDAGHLFVHIFTGSGPPQQVSQLAVVLLGASADEVRQITPNQPGGVEQVIVHEAPRRR
jgi:hypothetical protein